MALFSKNIDSEKEFFERIRKEYAQRTIGQIPAELLNIVSVKVSAYYYDQYKRFRRDHPKSIKRYSTFQIKDLDHPSTYELVINSLKEEVGNGYEKHAQIFLKMSFAELKQFEKSRQDFYDMF